MNPSSSDRKTYGILPLTPAIVQGLQLDFGLIEAPAPRARFLNFPLADDGQGDAAPRTQHKPEGRRAA